jgi:hypothetical protein
LGLVGCMSCVVCEVRLATGLTALLLAVGLVGGAMCARGGSAAALGGWCCPLRQVLGGLGCGGHLLLI